MKIKEDNIGQDYAPYIIAEMSANHNGDIQNALNIILKAKECGASAVKIQTYKPETITLNCSSENFIIKGGLWDGRTLFDLYEEAHLPWDWHKELFDYAQVLGITLFSSPFDETAVDFLEELNCPAYKIASFEAVDIPLIEYAASTKKPLIISTGMASLEEIQEAVDAAKNAGCKDLSLLHCVSSYPALAEDYNLRTISDMRQKFDTEVGLSDHTLGITTALTSISLGASIIEKHFTLSRNGGGPDDSFSIEPDELKRLSIESKVAWNSLGEVLYRNNKAESSNLIFRRSIYFIKDMKKGEIISRENIKSVRPGDGLAPRMYNLILGKKLARSVKINTPVKIEDIEKLE